MLRRVAILPTLTLLGACSGPIGLGTDIVWSTDFETGSFLPWTQPPGIGGSYATDGGPTFASVAPSQDYAHSGRYSAKFTSTASNLTPPIPGTDGAGLFKEAPFPQGAYYSAWYYIPKFHQTTSDWIILKFKVPSIVDAGPDAADSTVNLDGSAPADEVAAGTALTELLDLNLVSLPPDTTGMALFLLDSRHQYLTAPLPDPVAYVKIGQWFQIECFYNNVATPDGEFIVWLDGKEVYDIHRPMSSQPWVYFTPCSLVDDLAPSDATLYIDDVAVSWSRVTPHGILKVPN